MPSLSCSALIFDLDGVLIDSNALYERHWEVWAERNGVPFSDIVAVHHGRPVSSTIRQVAPHLDAHEQALAYRAGLDETQSFDGIKIFAGVLDLLDCIPPDAWAIATSAPAGFARRLINQVGLPIPRVFITGDDVTLGKPHPMPYLRAAQALGVCADHCVVVEDAPAGVAAARAAGSYVIGVLTTNTSQALAHAHALIDSMADVAVQHQACGLQVSWKKALVPLG